MPTTDTDPEQLVLMAPFIEKLNIIKSNIARAQTKRDTELHKSLPPTRLVAVGKTKPVEDLITLYKCGQRNFGENYVAEIISKANDENLVKECPDIQWHFIGHLQSNKIKQLLEGVKNLFVVETVHSQKLAAALNKFYDNKADAPVDSAVDVLSPRKLGVLVQVNTSCESEKNGVKEEEVKDLVSFIINDCPALHFRGIMTIGADRAEETEPNPDFVLLSRLRETLCKDLNLEPKTFEVSMGMSGDYEEAIELGSTNVRVGSVLFGDRSYAAK